MYHKVVLISFVFPIRVSFERHLENLESAEKAPPLLPFREVETETDHIILPWSNNSRGPLSSPLLPGQPLIEKLASICICTGMYIHCRVIN